MKLTIMADGRWLLEIEDIVTPLEAFQVAQLADLLEVKPVEWGPVRELRRELDEAHVEVDNYAAGAESLRKTIGGLRSELAITKAKAHEFSLKAADRELELVKLREYVAARQSVVEAARRWVENWDAIAVNPPVSLTTRALYDAAVALNSKLMTSNLEGREAA